MIKVENLYKKYGKIEVINNFSYQFNEGNIYVIIGESGIGKSTLLKVVGGLIKQDGGDIYYDDYKLIKPFSNRELYKKDISFAFQDCLLIDEMTIEQNIKIIGKYEINEEIFKQVNLDKTKNDLVGNLSGGQKQKVALMRAIIKNPKYLFLDEITANLDEENGQIIIDYIFSLKNKDRTIIIVTHDKRFLNIADEVIKLEHKNTRTCS